MTAARPAATVLLVRDAAPAPELLMLRRHGRSGFAAGAWVFPGGTVDPADEDLDPALWEGIDPAAMAARFRLAPQQVLAMHVAAVRETFEESGVLLARRADGGAVRSDAAGIRTARTAAADPAAFVDMLRAHGLVLSLGALTYLSRWVTPAQEPRRYDTCFFVARAPVHQEPAHDEVETTELRWVSAAAALDGHAAGEFPIIYPTIKTLQQLVGLADFAAIEHLASAQAEVRSIQPHIHVADDGRYVGISHPDDPEYPHERYAQEPGG